MTVTKLLTLCPAAYAQTICHFGIVAFHTPYTASGASEMLLFNNATSTFRIFSYARLPCTTKNITLATYYVNKLNLFFFNNINLAY